MPEIKSCYIHFPVHIAGIVTSFKIGVGKTLGEMLRNMESLQSAAPKYSILTLVVFNRVIHYAITIIGCLPWVAPFPSVLTLWVSLKCHLFSAASALISHQVEEMAAFPRRPLAIASQISHCQNVEIHQSQLLSANESKVSVHLIAVWEQGFHQVMLVSLADDKLPPFYATVKVRQHGVLLCIFSLLEFIQVMACTTLYYWYSVFYIYSIRY